MRKNKYYGKNQCVFIVFGYKDSKYLLFEQTKCQAQFLSKNSPFGEVNSLFDPSGQNSLSISKPVSFCIVLIDQHRIWKISSSFGFGSEF